MESIVVKNLLDSHRAEIEKQLGYLVNVAKRLKLVPPTWEFSEVYEHEFTVILGTYGSGEDAEDDCETYIENCFDITLHVSETLKISGDWVFACSINHRASSMVQVYEDTIIPLKYNPSNDYCEHCHKKYPRVKSYVVLNKTSNEFKQIGKGCLKQFLGINPASYITMFEAISKFSPFVQGYGRKNRGGRLVDLAYNVQDMLRYTIHQVSKDNGVFTKSEWKQIVDGYDRRGNEIHKNIRTNQGESTIDKVKIRLDAIGFFRMNPNLLDDTTTVEQLEERIKFYSKRLELFGYELFLHVSKIIKFENERASQRIGEIKNLIYSTKQHLHAVKYRMLLNENILDYNEEYESIKLFANNLAIAQEGEKDYNSSFDQYKQLLKTVFLKTRTLQSNLKTIVSGYNFYVTQNERDKQNAIRKANAEFLIHIGTVGEKSTLVLKVISYKEGEGSYGTWKLWGMEDESGNKFSKFGEIPKKFTTIENEQTENNDVSIGSTINVTAMIKEHKVFREEKITVLGILSKTKGANYIYEVKKESKKTKKNESINNDVEKHSN